MNFLGYYFSWNLFILYLLASSLWLASCGLRTAPRNLPEVEQKTTLSDFKVQQRGKSLRFSWAINENERNAALKKFPKVPGINDYFLLKESQIQLGCSTCDFVELPDIRMILSSNSIKREGDHLYYYSVLPDNYFNLHQFELSHVGPDDELLSSPKTFNFRYNKLFPKAPAPNLKIIQIEDEKQILRYAFGKVVLTRKKFFDKDKVKLKSQNEKKADSSEQNLPDKQPQTSTRYFIIRLSWPQITDKGYKRFQGEGSYFGTQQKFKVNLYRMRKGDKWPETPINLKNSQNDYYLDKLKLQINQDSRHQLKDVQEDNTYEEPSFYIDLQGQNGDTWLYQSRLVDRFGNESSASETITVHLPKVKINGQSLSKNTDVSSMD